jgi:hypothetical protein
MLFNGGSSQNYLASDSAEFNYYGYEMAQASWNTLDDVHASNNTGHGDSLGAGVVFGPGSTDNYLFDYSMLNFNDVGVEFNGSQSNVVQSNAIWYNKVYGLYFIDGAQNEYAGNSLLGNGAPEFPTPPSIIVTSPAEGSSVNDTVTILWNESGQSISYTKVTIDGVPNIAVGGSFLWNTTGIPDGEHTVVVNVTDTGGFSASQTICVFTDNHLLAVETTLSRLNQTLASSIASESLLNQTLLKVNSQLSLLESQIGSLNATVQSAQAEVNRLKTDGIVAIAVVIVAVAVTVAVAVVLSIRRRQRRMSNAPSPEPGALSKGS